MQGTESPAVLISIFNKVNRRRFLFLSLLWGVPGFAASALGAARDAPPLLETLRAFLDALIPSDDISPGAVDVGVDRRIVNAASKNLSYLNLITQGAKRLNEMSRDHFGEPFVSLDEKRRIEVVSLAEKASAKTPERRLFNQLRSDAFFHYYADARAWPSLGYDGPPQPRGFPDYDIAPG